MSYLNDAICTTAECDNGHASIMEMDTVFHSMDPPSINAPIQGQFMSAHGAIMDSFAQLWGSFTDWIPFNPTCCTIQALGQQADQLTQKMQHALGQASVSGDSGGPSAPAPPLLPSLGIDTGTIVAIGVVLGLILVGPSLIQRR